MLLLAFIFFHVTSSDPLKYNKSGNTINAFAIINIHKAKLLQPTQCVIVMSCIRLACVFVTSRKVTIWHAFSYFISGRPLTLTHNHHFTVVMQVNLQ